MSALTRKQQAILDFLLDNQAQFPRPPSLNELCQALGLKSRGSLHLTLSGLIDAGYPIEATEPTEWINVPDHLRTEQVCYVLKVKGDSMIEAGILDGDWVIIEQRSHACNGEIVVALIDNQETTLKVIE